MNKPVDGWEGIYEVSDSGIVFRISSAKGTCPGRILKPTILANRRCYVTLRFNGARVTWTVSGIVARAFLGLPKKGMEINHKDGNPQNNKLSNLEYVTRSENLKHSFRTGLHPSNRGIHNPSAVLTEDLVRHIRTSNERGVDIARRIGVTKTTISDIRHRRTWTHI